jgi:uncharacterized protein YbjT (DUF2867 family)
MAGKILVLGGTGNVGGPLVAALVLKGESVKVGSRSGKAPEGAEGVHFDYGDPSTYPAALDGVNRLYVITPAGQTDPVGFLSPIIDAAATRNVKVVLQTAKGVESDDSIPYRQVELLLERSGARWAVVRPDWFSDNFHNYWLHGIQHGVIAVPAGEGRCGFIDVRDIAASAATLLTTDRFDGKAYNLTGPEALSYFDAAEILSRATGRTIAYTPVDAETFVGALTGAGVPEGYARFLAAIYEPVANGWAAGLTGNVELLTGHKPRSLAEYAKDHASRFKA